MKKYPNLLGVGPMKTGSSWLWAQLSHHTGLWFPDVKELDFFDAEIYGKGPHISSARFYLDKYLKKQTYDEFLAEREIETQKVLDGDLEQKLASYCSIFSGADTTKIIGEFTPGYAIIPMAMIRFIYKIMSDCKIIILKRDPIERVWSDMRQHALKSEKQLEEISADDSPDMYQRLKNIRDNKYKNMMDLSPEILDKVRNMTTEDFIKIFESFHLIRLRSDYDEIFRNWHSVFPENQIHVVDFEIVKSNPQGVLDDVCYFLDVEPMDLQGDEGTRNEEKIEVDIPKDFNDYLMDVYKEHYEIKQ